jgi:hypothetical protein
MSLIQIAKTNAETLASYNIKQIVAICGDGLLKDGSAASNELREFLQLQSSSKLAQFAQYCLDNSFDKSGQVLQDIVNEIGSRIGFEVVSGRYSGVKSEIGFDGLWKGPEGALIIEVKTTDTYRINLDTLANYAKRTLGEGVLPEEPSVLLVVGREDTGDLEAQVRGSKHAWRMRLVSIDSLVKLMRVREEFDDDRFFIRVQQILYPFEFTRVDRIIDLVFDTQKEVEEQIVTSGPAHDIVDQTNGTWDFTPKQELDRKRLEMVQSFYKARNKTFRPISRAMYISSDSSIAIACAVSKRYDQDYQPYWYAFHPTWLEFLRSHPEGFLILGCMDLDQAFAIPVSELSKRLDRLNQTIKEGGKSYWHIALASGERGLCVNMTKSGEQFDLFPFAFPLSEASSA